MSVFNPAGPSVEELKGLYVESNGYVSIDAAKFHRKQEIGEIKFDIVDGLGFDNKVVRLGDPLRKHLIMTGYCSRPIMLLQCVATSFRYWNMTSILSRLVL